MSLNTEQIHKLTKASLKGDRKSFEKLVDSLSKYLNVPQVKFALYAIIYQFAMNYVLDTGKYCEECGGKCCKQGYSVPVYNFDYEELRKNMRLEDLNKLKKEKDMYLLSRPCPFQIGWKCGINSFKPYACLSYPFGTEDEQKFIIDLYKDGIPNFHVPEFCISGKKVKEKVDEIAKTLEKKLGRTPTPMELYNELYKLKNISD